MKSMKRLAVLLIIAVMGAGMAQAGLKFGVKAGVNVNHLSTDLSKNLDKNNRAGFTAGVMGEYMLPMVGFGFDLSVMYSRLNSTIDFVQPDGSVVTQKNKNFIEIPLNLKYKISLPVVGSFFAPYVFTGPSFGFKLDKNIVSDYKTKTFQTVWNVGLGLEFAKHLQIGASYGFGMNNIVKAVSNVTPVKYHNNYWTVTAAYLF